MILLLALTLSLVPATASPPSIINHQGRITVNGSNFDGTGHFKFALIDEGTASHWSNDGSSTFASEPTLSVAVQVTKGHYAVGLGDTSVPGMGAFPADIFAENNDLKLRIWFSQFGPGGNFESLRPDQKLSSVPYALSAHVPDDSIGISQLNNNEAPAGKILSTTADGIEWLDNPLTQSTSGISNGIGIAEPTANLHLGAMNVSGYNKQHPWGEDTIIAVAIYSIVTTKGCAITQDSIGQYRFHLITTNPSFESITFSQTITDPRLNGATNIVVKDDTAFVIHESTAKITLIDLTPGFAPQIIGAISDARLSGVNGIAIDANGTTLYATARISNSVVTIDISNPSTPQIIHQLTHTNISSPTSIWRNQDHLYAGGIGKVSVISISDNRSPSLITTYSDPLNIGTTHHITVLQSGEGAQVLIIDSGTLKLTVVDVSNPAAPSHSATYNLPAKSLDMTRSNYGTGNRSSLALALENGTHMMIDFTDPTSGHILGSKSITDLIPGPYTHGAAGYQAAFFFSPTEAVTTRMFLRSGLIVEGYSYFRNFASFDQDVKFEDGISVAGRLLDGNSTAGIPGQVLTSTGTGVDWKSPTPVFFTSDNSKSLSWDETLDQFVFSNDLAISGMLRAGGSGAIANTPYHYFASSPPAPKSGDIANSGDVYIDRDLEVQQTIYVGNSVQQLSDRNAKEQFAPVDASDILEKVAALPITTWQYKARSGLEDDEQKEAAVRHIGPVAQDFYAAFEIGLNDRTIATVDADGIALAAIQALKIENDTLKKQNAAILKRLEVLEASSR